MFFANRRLSQRNQRMRVLVNTTGQQAFQLALQYSKDSDEAKDIVQQSLLKVMESFRLPDDGLNYWFLHIVRNTALDKVRHRATKQRLANDIKANDELRRSQTGNSYERTEQLEMNKTMINACLENLTIEQREIIVLKDLHDYSYEQIAKILDIAKGTVMSRLHRARLALKNEVLKFGGTQI